MSHVMNTYARLPIALDHGNGCWVTDSEGKTYLDGLSGIAVSTLGHNHPDLVKAITEQAGRLLHSSNLYRMQQQEALADKLVALSGMDEVFYIGDDKCPRCGGRDKAELFAGEVNRIQQHLSLKNRKLWIWGDRLIDGKTTGIGMWEASMNNTHRAIDLISKEVMICDWHYERPDQSAVLFAMKGLNVVTCPWRNPSNAVQQTRDMFRFRETATPQLKEHFNGMMQTVWSGAGAFLDEFYGRKTDEKADANTQSNCFRAMFAEIEALSK